MPVVCFGSAGGVAKNNVCNMITGPNLNSGLAALSRSLPQYFYETNCIFQKRSSEFLSHKPRSISVFKIVVKNRCLVKYLLRKCFETQYSLGREFVFIAILIIHKFVKPSPRHRQIHRKTRPLTVSGS